MSEHVKRDYRSGLRSAQAEQTRRSIVSAAARLFVDDGYGATTIDAVAESAGVSRKTVFTAVGGKVDLLKTALDWAVAGDDQPVQVADRPEMRELLAMDDPVALLTSWARVMVVIDVRVAGLFGVLEIAADGDANAHLLLDEYRRQRLVGARAVVKRLRGLQALTEGMSRVEAADMAWLATDPVLYDRLVRTRGWSAGKFEVWLARTLTDQLLARQSRRRS
jgi:AcrR family transcriptional regulator